MKRFGKYWGHWQVTLVWWQNTSYSFCIERRPLFNILYLYMVYLWKTTGTYLPNLTKEGQHNFVTHNLFLVTVHLVFCVNPLSALIHCTYFKLNALFVNYSAFKGLRHVNFLKAKITAATIISTVISWKGISITVHWQEYLNVGFTEWCKMTSCTIYP